MKKINILAILILLSGMIQSAGAQKQDIEKIIQGMKIPRLTTAERDQIKIATEDGPNEYAEGQFIFNTDTKCLDFWNGSNWQELCLSNSLAKIDSFHCNHAYVYGEYYEKSSLNIRQHYITIPVTATTGGDYNIMAESTNGYYFQTSGHFSSAGIYELTLNGFGTPNTAKTDTLTIIANNNITVSNCPIIITVSPVTVSYRVVPNSIQVTGDYIISQSVAGNLVKVPIDVEFGGMAQFTVSSANPNGVAFTFVSKNITRNT